jgi:serine/threonine-protein kinase HipA
LKIPAGTPLDISLRWDVDDVQPVVRVAWRDHIAWLEYDADFTASGLELSPVHHKSGAGLQQPYDRNVFAGMHGMFHDSLPDGWGRLLIDRRARQLGIEPSTLTPLDRLACVGRSGIGALSYAPVTDIWASDESALDLRLLADDARRVLDGNIDDMLSTLGKAGGSPGGARPKALIGLHQNGRAVHGTDEAPEGFDHFLVKFPGFNDPDDIAAIEMAYAAMAREAGITMPETRLLPGGEGKSFFATRRFDRVGKRRVHVQSASGLLYADSRLPSLDYKDLIMLTRHVTRDQRECKAMFALAVFNVLAHNRDDHARQFSFIMEREGTWHLAPAYDLTWSMGPGGEHSSSIMGLGKNISRDHLIELAKSADVNQEEANEIIDRTLAATGNWKNLAIEFDVGRQSSNSIAAALKQKSGY